MKQAVVVLGVLLGPAGCSQVFGLEAPGHATQSGDASVEDTTDTSNRCVQDRFDGSGVSPMLWSVVGMPQYTVVDNAQHLVVSPPPTMNGTWGVRSGDLDLTSASVEVEVVQPAPFGTGEFTGLTITVGMSTFALLSLNNTFTSYIIIDGGQPTGTSMPWSAAYRFWRLVFDDTGTVTFQTRADAMATWQNYDTLMGGPLPTKAQVLIGVGILSTMTSSPGSGTFDNFLVEKSGCAR